MNAQNRPRAYIHDVSPGFFQSLGIRFAAGRTFTEEEMQGDRPSVAVVSENLVKRFWPGQDGIGKRIGAGGPPWITIIGVVKEMKYRGLPENPTADPDVFVPYSDRPRSFSLLVRTAGDPGPLTSAVRSVLRQAQPAAIVYDVSTMQQLIAGATARETFTGWLMAIFAGAALLLSMIGIYGVMAYSVSRRTQEIGIRMALGAARSQVVRMVVSRGMGLVGIGVAIGVAAAAVLTNLISSLLYGVGATDTATFAAASLVLVLVALAACLIPAARACRIHPSAALRSE